MTEWSKFKVCATVAGNSNRCCEPLDTISHISHVESALSILERGEILPYLVFDKSKLNDRRILVSWLSPNHWSDGFRYGNIRFEFDFKSQIKKKQFYWVEAIDYQPNACRILVTDKNHDEDLERYDPTSKDGPWWHDVDHDQHYYNGEYCLEFMLEGPISMADLRKFEFVKHHPDFCSIHRTDPTRCKELRFPYYKGGAMFMARAVASEFSLELISCHLIPDGILPNDMLKESFAELCDQASKQVSFVGTLNSTSTEAMAVAQAICSAHSFHQKAAAKKLASLFCAKKDCVSALAMVVSKTVGLTDWGILVEATE